MESITIVLSPPKRHLIFDEVETFLGDPVRIRTWASADQVPIILVSQTPDGKHPGRITLAVANWVHTFLLGYPESGFSFFEDGELHGKRSLYQVFFDTYGKHSCRQRLYRPTQRDYDWNSLSEHLGGEVER